MAGSHASPSRSGSSSKNGPEHSKTFTVEVRVTDEAAAQTDARAVYERLMRAE